MSATTTFSATEPSLSPLERFVRQYAERLGGGYDEIEPQVYDLLLEDRFLRVSFDPEALHEHSEAQLAALGSPLLDSLLDNAARRGATAVAYRQGLNLYPHDLPARLARAFRVPPKTALTLDRTRPMFFPQCVCWFEFTFESDQREQAILQVAIDLHGGRQVRHLDHLVDSSLLSAQTHESLPVARCLSIRQGAQLAAERAVRTAQSLANTRRRELEDRLESLSQRMTHYYDRMLDELAERAAADDEARKKLQSRRDAIAQERSLRLAEARQKHALRVSMRPVNLLVILQPKLQTHATWSGPRGPLTTLSPVYDPLLDAFEPVDCPNCGRPTFDLKLLPPVRLACPNCAT